ncbi:MAG: Fic family protein [Pseudohongiella sp.]|nr:Fic family protein [Pseudohongiella sp.]
MIWQPDQPWNNLPNLPPKVELDTKDVLKQCVESRAALGELKQAAKLIPNQEMLINILPTLEAKDSSAVENIVTTTDSLFQYAHRSSEKMDPATREALYYRNALHKGFESLKNRPLCTAAALEICSIIKNTNMNVRKVPGIKIQNATTGKTIYSPPEGESVIRDLLADWERFMHNDKIELDPLIRMAVGHYQFEAIHPFTDGNGRTGRVINSLYMIEQDLLTLPILYLSRYIIANKEKYYSLLEAVTKDSAWENWILYMLRGVEETSRWTVAKISAIRELEEHTRDYIKSKRPKEYSFELVETIFTQPYCRIANLVEKDIAKRQTASGYLKLLAEIGVLEERRVGKEKLFAHHKLITLLHQEDNMFEYY